MFVQHPTSGLRGIDTSKPGWVDALLAFHRTNFGDATMTAGEGEPPPPGQTDPPAGDGKGGDAAKGFPDNTPWREMTTEQQVAYWQHQSRRHEQRAGISAEHLAELRTKAEQLDSLSAASQTDQQRAVAEAEQRARAQALAEFTPKLVDLAITAAVAGRLPADQLATTLGPLDRRWFLTDDGQVDTAKVDAYAATLVPTGNGQHPGTFSPAANGYGFQPGAKPSGRDAGIAEAERRFAAATQRRN